MDAPLETDVHELWLDDAQHCVHDVVEFAARSLAIQPTTQADAGLGGGPALVLDLELAPAGIGQTAEAPHQRWRERVQIEEISGRVVLDPNSGVWTGANLRVGYSMAAGDGRPMRGLVTLEATLTSLDDSQARIDPPGQAAPFPERTRYEIERQRILHGLAAP